ncbi:MAG: four helix bundle protein [Ferruginibacter sp.]|nr:four helix bundle protein [Ferruginibacter sp.]
MSRYDLEDRLIRFACSCLEICDALPYTKAAQNLSHQLSKSSTASALIYGEVQAAESNADFIHKLKLTLKELRETRINLRIILEKPILKKEIVTLTLKEANELMAIFIKSIDTSKRKHADLKQK